MAIRRVFSFAKYGKFKTFKYVQGQFHKILTNLVCSGGTGEFWPDLRPIFLSTAPVLGW